MTEVCHMLGLQKNLSMGQLDLTDYDQKWALTTIKGSLVVMKGNKTKTLYKLLRRQLLGTHQFHLLAKPMGQ